MRRIKELGDYIETERENQLTLRVEEREDNPVQDGE
jgi:hypothetical protein